MYNITIMNNSLPALIKNKEFEWDKPVLKSDFWQCNIPNSLGIFNTYFLCSRYWWTQVAAEASISVWVNIMHTIIVSARMQKFTVIPPVSDFFLPQIRVESD